MACIALQRLALQATNAIRAINTMALFTVRRLPLVFQVGMHPESPAEKWGCDLGYHQIQGIMV
jgi:hypothetical protein